MRPFVELVTVRSAQLYLPIFDDVISTRHVGVARPELNIWPRVTVRVGPRGLHARHVAAHLRQHVHHWIDAAVVALGPHQARCANRWAGQGMDVEVEHGVVAVGALGHCAIGPTCILGRVGPQSQHVDGEEPERAVVDLTPWVHG